MIRMYNQSILARPKHRDIENMFGEEKWRSLVWSWVPGTPQWQT